MSKYSDLTVEEQRNEILKAIHNRLSEISVLLEFAINQSMGTYGLRDFQAKCENHMPIVPGVYTEIRKERAEDDE